jgi:hypothetical protein
MAGKDPGISIDLVVATSKKFEPRGLSDILNAFTPFLPHTSNLKQTEAAFT